MQWEVVIGLETHVQLLTKSKLFSGASTAFGAEPNTQADLISLAMPGVLPVLNQEAVSCAIKFGLSIDAEIARQSIFARKNYFYPDLPKGYQISQYELPIVGKGEMEITVGKGEKSYPKKIRITRAHLEEDAGKSIHDAIDGMSGIDLNRAGIPLLEIVTEPDMRSGEEAVAYAKKLHNLVQWIGICDGNMQEGNFRCDVNVSVRPEGSQRLGTRREIKNLNSFRFMQEAITYEVNWQIETLTDGGKIDQATVLFDPTTGTTHPMRMKEEANDYRYFPEPDLLPLQISEAYIATVKNDLPELPSVVQQRFIGQYQLSEREAEQLTQQRELAVYFEIVMASSNDAKLATNWVIMNLAGKLNAHNIAIKDISIAPETFARLLNRISDDTISNNAAKQVFEYLWTGETDVDTIIQREGLQQVSDASAILVFVEKVIAENPNMVAEYLAGKEKALNALVGQIMKASKGQANPSHVQQMLRQKLRS